MLDKYKNNRFSIQSSFILILFFAFVLSSNAQEISWFTFKIQPQEKPSGYALFTDIAPDEAALIVYSSIPTLEFSNSEQGTLNAIYKADEKKYIVALKAEQRQTITVKNKDTERKFTSSNIIVSSLSVQTGVYYSIEAENSSTKVGKGEFFINSNPTGAIIYIDGYPDFRRETPFKLEKYKSGDYEIKLVKQDYDTITQKITIEKDRSDGNFTGELVPSYSDVTVNVKPENAYLEINDEKIKVENGKVRLNRFQYGNEVTLLFKAPHYYPLKKQCKLGFNNNYTFNDTLIKKMGWIEVSSKNEYSKNAQVLIDGKLIGTIPIEKYPLQEGEYNLQISKTDMVTLKEKITINDKLPLTRNVEMTNLVNVTISSDPLEVTFNANGKINTTPATLKLPIGTNNIKFEKPNFVTETIPITVYENSTTVQIKLASDNLKIIKRKIAINTGFCIASWGAVVGGITYGVMINESIRKNYEEYKTATTKATELHSKIDADSKTMKYSIGLGIVAIIPAWIITNNLIELKEKKQYFSVVPTLNNGFVAAYTLKF